LAIGVIQKSKLVSDEELMAAVQQGDREAFDRLVQKYQLDAVRLAYHYVRNWEDAKDLSQDVFVKIFLQADKYDPSQPFRPWFFRVLINHVLNFLDRKKRVPMLSLYRSGNGNAEFNILDAIDSQDPEHQGYTAKQAVWMALEKLSEKHRSVVILHELHGLKEKEVAQILNCSVGTVKSRLHYAKKVLKKILAKEFKTIGVWDEM
jgi:RNA polymerase sigma-70 factor (ECF subfamily)